MFALALADVAICISYATTTAMGPAMKHHAVYKNIWSVFNYGVEFSLMVLTVIAVERYWSIARPHSFTFSPRRGKVALVLSALIAMATLIVMRLFKQNHFEKTATLHMMLKLGFCTLVIIIMYTLLARELLLRIRRKKTQLHPSAISTVAINTQHNGETQQNVATTSTEPTLRPTTEPSTSRMSVHPITKKRTSSLKHTQETKAALMLFVVTVVFLACWVPVWLRALGATVPGVLVRVYVIQSVVNPVIYVCMSGAFRDDVIQFFASCRR